MKKKAWSNRKQVARLKRVENLLLSCEQLWRDVSATLPGPRRHKNKSYVENGMEYWLCSAAVAAVLLVLNYQSQIKLTCKDSSTQTCWACERHRTLIFLNCSAHGCSFSQSSSLYKASHEPQNKIRVCGFIRGSVQNMSIPSESICLPAYISNNSLHVTDRRVTAVYHVNS